MTSTIIVARPLISSVSTQQYWKANFTHKRKAIYYSGKLVDLWKDADPELQPRVEAARRAMTALSPDQ